jgi:uncharacterized protein with ParB-like and HNH nuclease domain
MIEFESEKAKKYLDELSVERLFSEGQYIIPIYQRNYAWGEPEIDQLIQDILDVAKQSDKADYYIGSLVVNDRNNGNYETIDGQQRHTTLSIILAALKNKFGQPIAGIDHSNLGFDSRPKSDQTLRSLFPDKELVEEYLVERSIRSAYEIVCRCLSCNVDDIGFFARFLLKKVKILRVIVPDDTDLNHYFEIMNNRGEQLEKHEVLKARLMKQLETNQERYAFAKVWDACADMNRYVQLGIDSGFRKNLFSDSWNAIPISFNNICESFSVSEEISDIESLLDIIEKPKLKEKETIKASGGKGTFGAVINFSNFLLHVLRLDTKEDVPLDDKRLLSIFDEKKPDPTQFLTALLKCRMLFDRYIIKRENDEGWSLQTLKYYGKNEDRKQSTFDYVNSAEDENKHLIMLLSMFHVSFPALVYKHWLNDALSYLYKTSDDNGFVNGQAYFQYLEGMNDRFFYGRFGVSPEESIDYFDLTYRTPEIPTQFDRAHLEQSTDVKNFIFNRLDYLLWKRLKVGEVFSGVDMAYISDRIDAFSFTFRTSVEHYYPQNPLSKIPLVSNEMLPLGVNSFGNLCLISRSNNSKLSNNSPKAKKDHYEKATTIESLKQIFMMSYEDWGPSSINAMAKHEEMMVAVLTDDEVNQ